MQANLPPLRFLFPHPQPSVAGCSVPSRHATPRSSPADGYPNRHPGRKLSEGVQISKHAFFCVTRDPTKHFTAPCSCLSQVCNVEVMIQRSCVSQIFTILSLNLTPLTCLFSGEKLWFSSKLPISHDKGKDDQINACTRSDPLPPAARAHGCAATARPLQTMKLRGFAIFPSLLPNQHQPVLNTPHHNMPGL